jgi:hypothetical protein
VYFPLPGQESLPTAAEEKSADSLNIDELMQQLLAQGLVTLPDPKTTAEREPSPPASKKTKTKYCDTNTLKNEPVKPVDLDKPETMKQ